MATIQTQGFTLDNSGKRIVVDPITRIEGGLEWLQQETTKREDAAATSIQTALSECSK